MEPALHPLAPHHLPSFITPPGQTDTLLVVMAVFLVCLVLGLGILYFKLHSLPEQWAHHNPNKMQFEIVAVLALIALFTHNTNFYFAALILAMVRFPDYETPLQTIASAVTRLVSGTKEAESVPEAPAQPPAASPRPVSTTDQYSPEA